MSERDRLHGRVRFLEARAALNAYLREFFAARGFLEIEAPIAVPSPGLELHLDAFALEGGGFLITSPEYQMKRLLAAGLPRIYSLGKVFRRGEVGPRHNPEFTMLEWYRLGAGWQAIADDVEALCAGAAERLGWRAPTLGDLAPPWERVSVKEAMARWAGVVVDGDEDVATLRARAAAAGHRLPGEGAPWDDVFFTVFLDAVEPHLGTGRPTVLYDWPLPLAALARKKPGDPRVVERFEAYLGGAELCNGFGELLDPVEQRARLEADLAERRRRGLPAYPVDERFLASLGELAAAGAEAAGVALGVDRLLMVLTGAGDIRDVLPFAANEL